MNSLTADKIYIATFSTNALEVAKEYGFGLEINDLCISSNLNPENREIVTDRIKREIDAVYGESWIDSEKDKRRKVVFHGPFTELTPAAIDSRAIALMEERYNETLDIAKAFGVKDIVLHDGYLPLIYEKQWHLKKSVEFWKKFLDGADDEFVFYIENVFDDEPYLLTEIVDKVNRSNFKICLDVGHANCVTKEMAVEEWIAVMGERIGHFHIHNNDGSKDQHNSLEEGSLDMATLLELAAQKASFGATFTVESRDALSAANFLKNLL